MLELILIALGLAMDCVAVSAATAVGARGRLTASRTLAMASVFGGMQALMAGIGWAGGVGMQRVIESWDHWIAFGLLLLIGGKMIYEGLSEDEEGEEEGRLPGPGQLLMLGIATSIDSAAVGVTLPLLAVSFWTALGIIGSASFLLTLAAVWAADRLAGRFSERLEIVGGLVLIGIGVRILVEHLSG
jgi:manganese efflux pump family protein